MNNMGLKRELSNPLTEEEANSLTDEEKAWLRSWNRDAEIPGEEGTADQTFSSLYPNGVDSAPGMGDGGAAEAGQYDELSVEELKDELRDRELPVSGNKQELIERLESDDADGDNSDGDEE